MQYKFDVVFVNNGERRLLRSIEMVTPPPVYPQGTSVAINGACYTVRDTLVSIDGDAINHRVHVTY